MKKVLAILLTVLMIVSMAACAKTDGAAGTTTPATTKGNDSKPADTTPADTTPTEPSLVEAAKAEGELVVYGSCEEEYLAAACENFEKLYGIHYIIPENATFATAIGAGLCSLRDGEGPSA